VGAGGRHHPPYAEAFRIPKLNFLELRKAEVQLLRIYLLGTRVKKGKNKRKGRGIVAQTPASSKRHQVGLWKL
jgi:hypothetical protein